MSYFYIPPPPEPKAEPFVGFMELCFVSNRLKGRLGHIKGPPCIMHVCMYVMGVLIVLGCLKAKLKEHTLMLGVPII